MDHMPTLINASIAEAMLRTERRVNDAGAFEWRWRDGDGSQKQEDWSPWAEQPPLDFFGDTDTALRLLSKFCGQNGLTFEAQLIQGGHWAARIGRITGEGQAEVVGKPVMMATLAQSACMAICSVIKVDLAARHRELFPGHYIAPQ
jgi:hypothetical protein